MTVEFRDLDWRVRRERISAALDAVLADGMSWPTRDVVDAICDALRAPKAEVSRTLAKMATQGDTRAHKTGETFVMYGRTMHRLVWRRAPDLTEDLGEGRRRLISPEEVEEFRRWQARRAAEKVAAQVEGRDGLDDLLG